MAGTEELEKKLTGRRELRVHPLAHDTLQPQTRAHERDRDERERVRPRGVAADLRDAPLPALPRGERGGHGEERLNEGADAEPRAGLGPHAVADAAERRSRDESEHGGEGLLVREVEGSVALARGPGEEARERERELDGVAGLEAAPDEDRGEGDRVTVCGGERSNPGDETREALGRGRGTHMKPVMKQYAASGKVDWTGSTSVMRWRVEKTVRGLVQSCAVSTMVLRESLEEAGCGRVSAFCSA